MVLFGGANVDTKASFTLVTFNYSQVVELCMLALNCRGVTKLLRTTSLRDHLNVDLR